LHDQLIKALHRAGKLKEEAIAIIADHLLNPTQKLEDG
jgi:hypothetical protein